MTEFTVHYDNLAARQAHIAEAEANGYVMLHDDFDPDWKHGDDPHGTLTFTKPVPKSDEQLYQEQLEQEFNDIHDKAILALKNWDSLTLTQKDVILKNLLKWVLWTNRRLKLGVL